MNGYLKLTAALAAFALLVVVMGLSTQTQTVDAQSVSAWVQSCDPYPDRTDSTPSGDASNACPETGDLDDHEYTIDPTGSETLTVRNPRFAASTAKEFTSSTTLAFVPRTSDLRENEISAFSGDRIQITSDSTTLGASFTVVLVDNAAPSLVTLSPVSPLVVKGGVNVTFSAEFTDSEAGFTGSKGTDAGIEDLTGTVGNLVADSVVPEGGVRLVVAGQVVGLPASSFTKIDNGWRVSRELSSTNIQNIAANVPWYIEVADRANNMARTSGSVTGTATSATGGNVLTDARFAGALSTATFSDIKIKVTATRTVGGKKVTVTSGARDITTFTAGTGAFEISAVDSATSSIFADADAEAADYQCPFDDSDANTTTDCDLATGDKYELVASNLVTVDSQRPSLTGATTGKGWSAGRGVNNKANSVRVMFADDGKTSGDAAGSGIDPATVTAAAFSVSGNSVESTQTVGNSVYLTLSSNLGSTDTPTVTVNDGVVKDKAGNTVAGTRTKAADGLGPNLTLTKSASISNDKVTITIASDEQLKQLPQVWVQEAAANGAAAIDTTAASAGGVRQSGAMTYTYSHSALGSDPEGVEYNVYVSAIDIADNARTVGDDETAASTSAFTFELDKRLNEGTAPVVSVADVDAVKADGSSSVEQVDPMIVTVDFSEEGDEYPRDSYRTVTLTSASLKISFADGTSESKTFSLTTDVTTPDNIKFTIPMLNPKIGTYALTVQAMDSAGNVRIDGTGSTPQSLTATWKVGKPSPVTIDLDPGWNLISLPFQPANPAINSVIPASHPVDIVMTFDNANQVWMVSRRDAETGLFVGDITVMTASTAYFVRTSNFQKLELLRPPLATAAAAPPPPPAITVVEGWNLVPVVTNTPGETRIAADDYFGTLGSGGSAGWLKALTFDTLSRNWMSVTPGDTVSIGVDEDNPCTGRAPVADDVEDGTEPCQMGNYSERSTGGDDTPANDGPDNTPDTADDVAATGGPDGFVGQFDVNDRVTVKQPVQVGKGYWLYATADGVIIP